MPIVLLGLSHRTAPPQVRDRHTVPADRIADALVALSEYSAIREAVILSTCNRLEIYADVDAYESGIAQLKEFLTTYRAMEVEDFDKYLYTMLGAEAVEQLYRVASGLDSMLIGESQIMSQVKQALQTAHEARSVGVHLGRLFRTALQTGKDARSKTAIGHDVVSLGAAAVELAQRHRDIAQVRCVVLGAGKMGSVAAKHLAARGASSIAIVNRTLRHGQALAKQIKGASACGLPELAQVLEGADLVITAVGCGEFLITEDMLRTSMAKRAARDLLIVDIGAPRDVEPAAATVAGTVVYSLEDLREVVNLSLEARQAEIPAVEKIIVAQVGAYLEWYRTRRAAPLIASLRRKAEVIRHGESQRLFARLPELDDRQRELVIAASVTIINKLLHAPVTKLRQHATDRAIDDVEIEQALVDLDAFGDRLQRQLDAHTAPLLGNARHD
jgi:glutamyl-tRNA reductase